MIPEGSGRAFGASHSWTHPISELSPVLALLAQAHPEVQIWLELLDRRVDLIGEAFDVDIRMADVTEPHLVRHLIARNKRILCASPEYLRRRGSPERLAELAMHDSLLYRERHLMFGVWRMDGPNGPESVKVTGQASALRSPRSISMLQRTRSWTATR